MLFAQGCQCNGRIMQINEKLVDGECKSVRRFENKIGLWKYWCFVDQEENCEDDEDGWSFEACEGKI